MLATESRTANLLSGFVTIKTEVPKPQPIQPIRQCTCTADEICRLHARDELTRRNLKICWTLSGSKEFRGELPALSHKAKETITQEAILWAAREKEADKWRVFQP